MKLIDADKLIAEIDNSIAYCQINYSDDYALGFEQSLREVKNFITSLPQGQLEVDLEKEMKEYFKGWTETEEGIACHYQYVDLNTCHGIARHFYELGLNARKK